MSISLSNVHSDCNLFSIRLAGNSGLFNLTHNDPKWWGSYAECPLLDIDSDTDKIRMITEIIQLAGAFLYLVAALREMKFLGYHMFIENLVSNIWDLYFGHAATINLVSR